MKTYRTKLEAYEAGADEMRQIMTHHGELELARGIKIGIAQERARAKKKLNPHYNRPLSLKERVDREAEAIYPGSIRKMTQEEWENSLDKSWKALGKTKQPSLWQRLTRPIIRELKGFFRP